MRGDDTDDGDDDEYGQDGDQDDSDEDNGAYNELGADGVLGLVLRTAFHLDRHNIIDIRRRHEIFFSPGTHQPSHQHYPQTYSPTFSPTMTHPATIQPNTYLASLGNVLSVLLVGFSHLGSARHLQNGE